MVNVEELFEKLENGEPIMEHEIIYLKELLRLVDELYERYLEEYNLAEAALEKMNYYRRLSAIRKYDKE